MHYTQVLAPALFLLTLYAVLARPRRMGPATAAGGGAVLALLTGVVGWRDVLPAVLGAGVGLVITPPVLLATLLGLTLGLRLAGG